MKKNHTTKTVTEILIRLLFFILMPAAFSSGFLGVKLLFTAIGKGEPFNIGSLWILIGLTLFLTNGASATQDILVNFLFYVT